MCECCGGDCQLCGGYAQMDPSKTHVQAESFYDQMQDISKITAKQMEECIKFGWRHVQSDCRPDESFRAMLQIMIKWMAYIEKEKNTPNPIISKIQDMGRVQERIKSILDDDIFDTLSKHNPYWDSEYELEADKLGDLRRKFSCFQDNLWDIMGILRKEEEE